MIKYAIRPPTVLRLKCSIPSQRVRGSRKKDKFCNIIILSRCDNFYENSNTSNKRTTSLGYGKKYDFTKEYLFIEFSFPQTPAPGSYEHENVFEDSRKKKKGFGFGTGRG